MKKLRSRFDCPLCKTQTHMEFKKPDYFTPVTIQVQCVGCASKFKVLVKHKRADTKQVNMTVTHLQVIPEGGKDATAV